MREELRLEIEVCSLSRRTIEAKSLISASKSVNVAIDSLDSDCIFPLRGRNS